MDLGLYNKANEPRGDHGTMIGNWVEERALKQQTGVTRHEDFIHESIIQTNSSARLIAHRDHADSAPKLSITQSSFPQHDRSAHATTLYPKAGSSWRNGNDPNMKTHTMRMTDSQVALEKKNAVGDYTTTTGSTFLPQTRPTRSHIDPRTVPPRPEDQIVVRTLPPEVYFQPTATVTATTLPRQQYEQQPYATPY